MKELLEPAKSKSPERFALLAFHQGVISTGQLRKILREWIDGNEPNLEQLLVDKGLVTAEERAKLYGLMPDLPKPTSSRVSEPTRSRSSHRNASANGTAAEGNPTYEPFQRRRRSHGEFRMDYYDSIHEHFTTDTRLSTFLISLLKRVKKRFSQQMHQIGRSSVGLAEIAWYNVVSNWHYVLATVVGVLMFVAGISLNSWLGSPTSEPLAGSGQTGRVSPPSITTQSAGIESITPNAQGTIAREANGRGVPAATSEGVRNELTNQSVSAPVTKSPSGTIPSGQSVMNGEELVSVRPAIDAIKSAVTENNIPSSSEFSVNSNKPDPAGLKQPQVDSGRALKATAPISELTKAELASVQTNADQLFNVGGNQPATLDAVDASNAEVLTEPTAGDFLTVEEQTDALLADAYALIEAEKFEQAFALLDGISAEDVGYDRVQVQLAQVATLFAWKEFDRGGSLLLSIDNLDQGEPIVELLFSCWLLYATPPSRAETGDQIRRSAIGRPGYELAERRLAWIQAKNRNSEDALRVLDTKPLFGERTFADNLFYAVALYDGARKEAARAQLAEARKAFEVEWKPLRQFTVRRLPSAPAIDIMAKAIDNFAAVLEK
ncbi:MAG: hypothetical protein KDB22_24035 [Planctomycetales bacterium]|nr:hypothetical protein [Planctomycetales bacterium]